MIQVENLTKRFGDRTAVEDVSFEVKKGEILGFLGPNGAGKTTTMRILAGYFPPTAGRASVGGFDTVEQGLEVKKRVGYMPEHPPLYTEMTVDAYLSFVATIKGVERRKIPERVEVTKMICGLHDMGPRLIKHLSKGFRQRVGLAQAMIHQPPVLILDEPTVGLDPKQIIEVRELIRSLGGEHTVILSTHILPEVSVTCQRVIIINNGRIVAVDTPENLTRQLRGVERIELTLGGRLYGVTELLSQAPRVVGVTLGEARDGRLSVFVEAQGGQDIRHILARNVVEAGLELYELKTQTMTLEEIFLKLTTEEPQTEGAQKEEVGA